MNALKLLRVGWLLFSLLAIRGFGQGRTDVLENVNKQELELGAVNMAVLIYLVDKYGL